MTDASTTDSVLGHSECDALDVVALEASEDEWPAAAEPPELQVGERREGGLEHVAPSPVLHDEQSLKWIVWVFINVLLNTVLT